MAPKEKICARIAELISRPQNVDYEEIEWVMNQLNAKSRPARHGTLFSIPGCSTKLLLNKHNNGKTHLPEYCVRHFCDRMIELGLYDQE